MKVLEARLSKSHVKAVRLTFPARFGSIARLTKLRMFHLGHGRGELFVTER